MNRWKLGVAVALLAGLALTIGSIWYVGAGSLLASVERIGWTGFGLYVLYNLVSFFPVGWAWWSVAAPGQILGRWLLFPGLAGWYARRPRTSCPSRNWRACWSECAPCGRAGFPSRSPSPPRSST